MKLFTVTAQCSLLLAGALLAGCVTRPSSLAPANEAASPVAALETEPGATPGAVAAEANVEGTPSLPVPLPALSSEASEFVARFTQEPDGEALPHQIVDNSSFPQSLASLQPGAKAPKFEYLDSPASLAPVEGLTADGNSTRLVVRDWTGLVLVPVSTSLSVAHTSAVRLLKVEAHPLSDGRVRIWVRVKNAARRDLTSEVACSFQMNFGKTAASPFFYELPVPSSGFRDVFFVSPAGKLNSYTVLVRQGR